MRQAGTPSTGNESTVNAPSTDFMAGIPAGMRARVGPDAEVRIVSWRSDRRTKS